MKTNVSIELSDAQRDYLATLIDDKQTKRLATREEITNLVQQFIGGTIAVAEYYGGKVEPEAGPSGTTTNPSLFEVDKEDARLLSNKSDSYKRGWNQVKRSRRA